MEIRGIIALGMIIGGVLKLVDILESTLIRNDLRVRGEAVMRSCVAYGLVLSGIFLWVIEQDPESHESFASSIASVVIVGVEVSVIFMVVVIILLLLLIIFKKGPEKIQGWGWVKRISFVVDKKSDIIFRGKRMGKVKLCFWLGVLWVYCFLVFGGVLLYLVQVIKEPSDSVMATMFLGGMMWVAIHYAVHLLLFRYYKRKKLASK